ncbi:uncharacterized protein N0V89_010113 [Didymosphaeria variabile]|uniref:Chromo domain-containing protein n=1 Tax=Didymosphaeria variabile TaxID=1932322 RepID=A0A9W9C8A4_9PLEO|nr:uncharacterized protein N0V89_010113 [Didymosphaeria variabile]KAJ4348735.1 hypothetical protein N0V89_010113 [Didymosphaeria variabile]
MKQSDLEAKRQAAAYTSDVGSSLEDSEESEHDPDHEFDVDDIIAGRMHEDDGRDVLQYLVKFTDYPIYECKWLEQSELNCKEVFERWRNKRKDMTRAEQEELSIQKDKEVKEAKERVTAAKERRHQKRAKLKEEAARKQEESLKKKGVARKKAPSTRGLATPAKNKGKQTVSSERKRRVVLSSDDESFVAPSDNESETSSSDSEPLFERQARLKAQPNRTEHAGSAKAVSRASSPQKRRKSFAGVSSLANEPSTEAAPSAATTRRPSIPTGPLVTNEQSGPRAPGAIKLVNEPKQHQRKAWDTHGHHFKTLHYRAVAEKRSRAEGTPDINELEFVNGAPAGIPAKSGDTTSRTLARDNPYGRREPGQRRLAEIEPDDEPERIVPTTRIELQSYEQGKIPMTCFDWKNGNACRLTAERCRFLHREWGQDGKPLPVTTWDGKVPPKYRDPPEMCWFWFCEGSCAHPDDECIYAHKNTGHLSMRDHRTRPVDPHIENGSTAARKIGGAGNYPDVTCWNWLMDTKGCYKSSDQCSFAHRNTGLLGNTIGADFKPIDPEQAPVHARSFPKFQDPPQTCFFWLRTIKGCGKSADDCKYAHENTGWLADTKLGLCEIDRNEKPKFLAALRRPSSPTGPIPTNATPQRHIPKHFKTCFFWNEYRCRLSEEECHNLHCYTGVVVDPPSNWIFKGGWRPHFRDEPVSAQVQKPSLMDIDEHPLTHFDSSEPMQVDEPADEARRESTSQCVNMRDDGNKFTGPAHPPIEESLSLLPQEDNDRIMTIPDIQPVDMSRSIGEIMQLDVDEMFRCNGDQHEDVIASSNALLLYDPNEHLEELALIERWLAMHSVNIFSSLHMGLSAAWDTFKQLILDGGSGIIIAAPDFEGYASLPGFGDVLRGTVRLWSVGTQGGIGHSIWDPKASSETHSDRFAIFPHGGIIYITDDVFEKRPQLALSIFEQFFTKIEAGRKVDSNVIPGMYINDGLLLWRVGARPELVKWIGDICMNHQAEIEEGDPDYLSLEKLYVLLQDSGCCEPDGTFDHPEDNRRLDFFPIISMRQSLAEDIGLYYEARTRSQHEANTDMAHHYSGLVVIERRNYRHYFVVHTNPEMVDWKETITNIDEVITPEKCIEYFEQEPKGSKFDNYEWAYPEKRADSVTAPLPDSSLQTGYLPRENQSEQSSPGMSSRQISENM